MNLTKFELRDLHTMRNDLYRKGTRKMSDFKMIDKIEKELSLRKTKRRVSSLSFRQILKRTPLVGYCSDCAHTTTKTKEDQHIPRGCVLCSIGMIIKHKLDFCSAYK